MPRRILARFTARHRQTSDRGAAAVFVALTMSLLLAAAAAAIDTSTLAMNRQDLQNKLDSAIQIGASVLPGKAPEAVQSATDYLAGVYPDTAPAVSLWCVVASSGPDMTVVTSQIGRSCDPGTPGPYTNGEGGVVCDERLCAIPTDENGHPNTISIQMQLPVTMYFAPAIGIRNITTGLVTSTSCRGVCGVTGSTSTTTKYIQLPDATGAIG